MKYIYYGDLGLSLNILNQIGKLRTEKNNNRGDWGLIQQQLKAGQEISIRPATEKEKENMKRWALQFA
jgi:hypothetical protein